MKRLPYTFKKSQKQTWDDVFNDPCPITVESFETGRVIINKLGTLNPKHPRAKGIKDELLEVPILSHHLNHSKFGDYLIDAGLDASYYRDPRGNTKGLLAKIFADKYIQDKNQNIAFHLKKKQIKLNGVFLSHLHSDHIAGVRELPKDIHYVVGKGEKYSNYKPLFYGDYLKGIDILYEIDFSNVPDMLPLGPVADIFGDGSLWAISTPGHTNGHMSFLINSYESPVLLTADACFIKLGLDIGVGSSTYTSDIKLAQKTLDKLVEFISEYPQVKVVFGHES